MTSRERWRAVLKRKPVDRAPCDIWATPEVVGALCREYRCTDYWEVVDTLQIDAVFTIEPPYIGPSLPDGCDIWGVKYRPINHGTGIYLEAYEHPLAKAATVKDIENHPWPSPDWFNYSAVASMVLPHRHRPIRAGYLEPFLWYSKMRGMEQAMFDLLEAPNIIECAFDHMLHFALRQFERILDATSGQVDITVPSEDLGSQTGPLFSPTCFRKYHRPRFQKYIDVAKQAGVYVFYHTDGASRDFVPDLIDLGVDILNPIQWKCPGMDREGLKRDFGKKLIFHGAVENQEILPFGSPQAVRDEVIRCFDTLGLGGGYICAPCHRIQSNTPVENITALYDTIREIAADPKYTKPSPAES